MTAWSSGMFSPMSCGGCAGFMQKPAGRRRASRLYCDDCADAVARGERK